MKESSRDSIITAISETVAASMFPATTAKDAGKFSDSSWLAMVLHWHAATWDRFRAFLQPRAMRVYPEHLALVWRAYVRLAAIDLALRAAAHVHIAGVATDALEFLNWVTVDDRGEYLNNRPYEAGVSVFELVASVGVSENTVEARLYRGARPSDGNLARIASTLVSDSDPEKYDRLLREFRKLYWASDLARILGELIGPETGEEIVNRLHQYASLLYGIINDRSDTAGRRDILNSLATHGAHSEFSPALLAALVPHERDSEWKEDLQAAASDWTRRVLTVNLDVHRAEEDALIRDTEGRVLQDWDISNPEAYDHYRRSGELQLQGRIYEAIAEVEKAAKLDPLDPVNHFTLGSVKGGIGVKQGDAKLIKEGLEACWMAASLDPAWILPWAEIGFILLESGRPREAIEHLRAVGPERRPLDPRYHAALGAAFRELGQYEESLNAFELALELNPENAPVAAGAAIVAALAGDKAKLTRYRRIARHLGAPEDLDLRLELAKAFRAAMPPANNIDSGRGLAKAVLDASIRLNPSGAALYLHRARLHFLEEDDDRALSDVDEAIRLDPDNAGAFSISPNPPKR